MAVAVVEATIRFAPTNKVAPLSRADHGGYSRGHRNSLVVIVEITIRVAPTNEVSRMKIMDVLLNQRRRWTHTIQEEMAIRPCPRMAATPSLSSAGHWSFANHPRGHRLLNQRWPSKKHITSIGLHISTYHRIYLPQVPIRCLRWQSRDRKMPKKHLRDIAIRRNLSRRQSKKG